MDKRDVGIGSGLVLLAALAALYPLVPTGLPRDVWYDGVGSLSVGYAWCGVHRRSPGERRGWLLVLGGFLGWVLGDVMSSLEQTAWHLDFYPVPSDAIYLGSYVVLGAGLLAMVRGRRSHHDLSVVLDAAIIATGTAVLAGVFVLAPIAGDSSLTLLGKLVSFAYPLADVLMIGFLVRLWTAPGTKPRALRLLCTALVVILCGDVLWNLSVVETGFATSSSWNDTFWLFGYVLLAAACWSPATRHVTQAPRARSDPAGTRVHLVALTGGLALPAAALLLNGASGGPVRWAVIGVGSVVLSGLVLARMAGLLRVVQVQAVQLAALARSDGLTGAPNRRTWDHELSRACLTARDTGQSLCVALIDLDHFKSYNDTYGHQAGDLLLREAVALWTDLLGQDDMLARYGGEEFAVLLPGRTLDEARARLDLMLHVTPGGQTFSAGVAAWDPATDPAEAVRAADEAMYDAKRTGRTRVCVAGGTWSRGRIPTPTIVLQPIVDLRSGTTIAMEALSRFEGEDTLAVFERAQQAGAGPELEGAAIRAALLCRPRQVMLSVNVSLDFLTEAPVVDALPDDLSGIILEITEHSDVAADRSLDHTIADLRRRGARIAVDDWGRGFANLDRLLRLRPEVVKLDMSLVHGLASDYHRATIRSVTAWADEVGVSVCAEGVETETQRRILMELGVHTAQGYLFGRPAAPLAHPVDRRPVDDLAG